MAQVIIKLRCLCTVWACMVV